MEFIVLKSLLLLSGGMDSIAILHWKKPNLALTIDYGQNASRAEVQASQKLCSELGIKHKVITIDCSIIGDGNLSKNNNSMLETWPYRNQILITFAAAYASKIEYSVIYIGTVLSDKSQHADGSPEFLKLMNLLLKCQEKNISLVAPAVDLTTDELIKVSKIPKSLMDWAHSCYTSDLACGQCCGCLKQLNIYRKIGWEV